MTLHTFLFYEIHSLAHISSSLDWLAVFIATELQYIVIGLTFLVIVVFYDPDPGRPYRSLLEIWHRLRGFSYVLSSAIISWCSAWILKFIFQTPRPFLALSDVVPLLNYGGYDSFPSGHATVFASLAVSFYFYNKKLGYLFTFFALLIGLSRIVVGVHFPLDVLGGWLLGGLISYLLFKFYRFLKKKVTILPWLKHLP